MGFECSGVIEEVGEGITDFKIGDRVTAISEFGAWAELVAIPAKHVYHIPTDLEWKEAVALTLNYVVAQALLFDVGNLRDGQTILVHSVGGGVVSVTSNSCFSNYFQ
jgi:NADPH:quinone reductase-like Zn-dependent oxidoreductase